MTLTPNALKEIETEIMLKEIETEIIKNAQNGTDDMYIDAEHSLCFDCIAWDTYKLLFKGKTIVDFRVASYCGPLDSKNGHIDSKETKLFIDNKQIEGLNIKTISELLNAFKSIYKKQQDTRRERRKKIEEEEKQKKVVKPKLYTTTIFTMINEKIKGIKR